MVSWRPKKIGHNSFFEPSSGSKLIVISLNPNINQSGLNGLLNFLDLLFRWSIGEANTHDAFFFLVFCVNSPLRTLAKFYFQNSLLVARPRDNQTFKSVSLRSLFNSSRYNFSTLEVAIDGLAHCLPHFCQTGSRRPELSRYSIAIGRNPASMVCCIRIAAASMVSFGQPQRT